MKLTNKSLLRTEDYQDAEPWFLRFIASLNEILEQFYNILSKGIDESNLVAVYKDLTIQSYGTVPPALEVVANPIKGIPKMVILCRCAKIDGGNTIPIDGIYLHWSYDNGNIKYTLVGLDINSKYSITLRVE